MRTITIKIILVSLLYLVLGCIEQTEEERKYRYSIGRFVPDSNKVKMMWYVKELVRATDQHFVAGRVENQGDVIHDAERSAFEYYSIDGEGLFCFNCRNSYRHEFLPFEKLTPQEKRLFYKLKKQHEEKF